MVERHAAKYGLMASILISVKFLAEYLRKPKVYQFWFKKAVYVWHRLFNLDDIFYNHQKNKWILIDINNMISPKAMKFLIEF